MASTITPDKTGAVTLFATANVASATIVPGSPVTLTTKFAAGISITVGRNNGTALSNEVSLILQRSTQDTGDDAWVDVYARTTSTGKTAGNSTTLSSSASAGATTFSVASATGIAKGSKLWLKESTIANSEYCVVKDISGTTVTPMDPLTRAHTSGITITTLAERFGWTESLGTAKRLRLIVNSASLPDGTAAVSGQAVDVTAEMMTLDSVTGT